MKKIWLVEFPTWQYKENVKELAKKSDLKIIDKRFAEDIDSSLIASKVPKLTNIKEEQEE